MTPAIGMVAPCMNGVLRRRHRQIDVIRGIKHEDAHARLDQRPRRADARRTTANDDDIRRERHNLMFSDAENQAGRQLDRFEDHRSGKA